MFNRMPVSKICVYSDKVQTCNMCNHLIIKLTLQLFSPGTVNFIVNTVMLNDLIPSLEVVLYTCILIYILCKSRLSEQKIEKHLHPHISVNLYQTKPRSRSWSNISEL